MDPGLSRTAGKSGHTNRNAASCDLDRPFPAVVDDHSRCSNVSSSVKFPASTSGGRRVVLTGGDEGAVGWTYLPVRSICCVED